MWNKITRLLISPKRDFTLEAKAKHPQKITIYGDDVSPPVRFVLMTAFMLDVKINFRKIDLFKNENRSENYKIINPLQKVPALKVDDKVICDSHAIALYLCEQSKDNKGLYPANDIISAKINEMLFYNSGTLFPIDSSIFTNYFKGNYKTDKNMLSEWYNAMDHLENQLNKHSWLVGDKLYLCDLCCATTVTSLQLLAPLQNRHKKVKEWIQKLNELPCFEINKKGVIKLQHAVNCLK